MKTIGIKIAAMSLLLMFGAVTALADGKNLSGSISLSQAAQVNDVKLKPGLYDAKFNAETNELSISDKNRVLATVKVSVQSGEEKARENQAYLSSTDKGFVLSKLVFKGDIRVIVINEGNKSAAGQ